jgi:hypothetical protein
MHALRWLTATTSSRDPTLMVKGWNQAALTDPDKGGREQLGWQLAGQIGARIVPRQRRGRNMQWRVQRASCREVVIAIRFYSAKTLYKLSASF